MKMPTSYIFLAGIFCLSVPALAHHSFAAEYDARQPVTLNGTITKVEWVNPHAWLHLDVKDGAGKVESWDVELAPPFGLERRGWKRETISVGAEVSIKAYRHKDGSHTANARLVKLSNGRKLFAGSSNDGGPDE
jgi:hypothetical protein